MPQAVNLFAFTRWLLTAATILCAAVTVLLTGAMGIVMLALGGAIQIPIPPIEGASMNDVLRAGAMVILACAICVVLLIPVLVLIRRIVDSAATGDPFVAGNADRLNRIGWLMLASQGVGFVTGIAISGLPEKLSGELNFGFEASLSGLFAALLVFVLAQIFRHGSQMRAELEGTV
jgi:Protein of unknown function (DUF2975)